MGVLAPVSYEPIRAVGILSGLGQPALRRVPEGATQTFKKGALLANSSGYMVAVTFGGPETVYGVAAEDAANLTVAGTAETSYEGVPQNQTSARIIPVGAWPNDGKVGVYLADGHTIFSVALKTGQVYTAAMLGVTYGLTVDGTTGFWYLDNTDTVGDNAVAVVRGYDETCPNSATYGARVYFQFLASLRAF